MAVPDPARKPRGRGRHRDLDRHKIAAAALDLVRSDGSRRLTMRRIAAALDVDPAALYWHFADKEELLAEVAAHAARQAELPVPADGPWPERARALCQELRRVLREHPELALDGAARSPWLRPFNAQAFGALVRVLQPADLPPARLFHSAQALLHLVTAIASGEAALEGSSSRDDVRQFVQAIDAALPEDLSDEWRALGRGAASEIFDGYFDDALASLLAGIASRTGTTR
jgi:AcrR family transcriptional regulator